MSGDLRQPPKPLGSAFRHVAQGLLMGTADAIPGVSGGTMALIVGIYERLLEAIGTGFRAILALLRLDIKSFVERLRAVDWFFLVPLAVGIGTAILIAARIVPELLDAYPRHMRGIFLGMVTASIAIPWKRISTITRPLLAITAVAAVAAFFFSGIPPTDASAPSLIRVFLSAAVAICAMILPGVSGAFLLEVLGMYEPTLLAVNDRDLLYVAVFGAGAIAGLGSFSLLLTAMLRRWHDETMAALVGLMAGSLRALWPWQDGSRSLSLPDSSTEALVVVGVALAGFVFVLAIERLGMRRKPA